MVRWIFPNTHIPRSLTMPDTTLLDIPQEEQDQMLAALRRARYGYLLALHVLLLCAAGRNPTEIAAFLFCSRSSIYRIGFPGESEKFCTLAPLSWRREGL